MGLLRAKGRAPGADVRAEGKGATPPCRWEGPGKAARANQGSGGVWPRWRGQGRGHGQGVRVSQGSVAWVVGGAHGPLVPVACKGAQVGLRAQTGSGKGNPFLCLVRVRGEGGCEGCGWGGGVA